MISRARQASYSELVDRLIEDFRPAHRLWPVGARLTLWLALALAMAALIAGTAPRPNLSVKLHELRFVAELACFLIIATWTAALALRSAIPGRQASAGEIAAVATLGAAAVLVLLFEPFHGEVPVSRFIRVGLRCALCMNAVAALPWAALFLAVRRGATLAAGLAGALVGTAAFAFSFAANRMGCPIDDSLHILTWHLMPVLFGAALSALAGATWLKRKRESLAELAPRRGASA